MTSKACRGNDSRMQDFCIVHLTLAVFLMMHGFQQIVTQVERRYNFVVHGLPPLRDEMAISPLIWRKRLMDSISSNLGYTYVFAMPRTRKFTNGKHLRDLVQHLPKSCYHRRASHKPDRRRRDYWVFLRRPT